jgi:alkanesulfonate monooxygenase SsuD/methylene tetrahydromethanopterin reductase-like flavin-dependent oxidoreductase (luciferase family)
MYMMRFDLRAPGASPTERADLYQATLDMAAWAEDNGCASVVISEHHASDDGYLPSPLVVAAAVAGVTSKVTISVAAAILPFYDPVRLAEDLIVLDHLSRGRAFVVLGVGYREVEYELRGLEFASRGKLADEKLEVLLETLRDAGTDATKPRVTPGPFSQPMPMIAWGGQSKAAARRAGRHGLGFLAQGPGPGLEEVYVESCRASGHEPGLCYLPTGDAPLIVFVNDDLDQGWAEVGPAMLADAVSYHEWNEHAQTTATTVSLSSAKTVEELRAERGAHRVITSAEAAELVGEHGMLALHPLCGGLSPEVAWPYLRRAAAAVAPPV